MSMPQQTPPTHRAPHWLDPKAVPWPQVLVGATTLAQLLGTIGWQSWTPGLLISGGIDRFIDYGVALDWPLAHWARIATDCAVLIFWTLLFAAMCGIAPGAPPMSASPGERHWLLRQSRRVVVAPLLGILATHALGGWIAREGWWPVAALIETGGHIGMIVLLFVLLVPEARPALVVVFDANRQGLNNRLYIAEVERLGRIRWRDVHHRDFRRAALKESPWTRLLGIAHVEITYVSEDGALHHALLRGLAPQQRAAHAVSVMTGEWRMRAILQAMGQRPWPVPSEPHAALPPVNDRTDLLDT